MKKLVIFCVALTSLIFSYAASAETWSIYYTTWAGQIVKQSGQLPGPEFFYGSVGNGTTTEYLNATVYITNDSHVDIQLFFQDGNNCTGSAQKYGQLVAGTMVCSNGGGNIPFHALISTDRTTILHSKAN